MEIVKSYLAEIDDYVFSSSYDIQLLVINNFGECQKYQQVYMIFFLSIETTW